MEGQKSHAKLTRTQSSLLRSSPTIRSSIHSLSSINEDDYHPVSSSDEENQEKTNKNKKKKKNRRPPGLNRFRPVLALASFTFFTIVFFFFFYSRKDESPTSENLLLALIFIAVALFLANKNKGLIRQIVSILKHSWDENAKRLGFCSKSHGNGKPVRWFIGDSMAAATAVSKKKVVQNEIGEGTTIEGNEGVEVYSTGDYYEGEFHKGRANGSGVYNFFVNGRYEGDWVDGKYDGYGIESWARGSRYRGQYRQGMRHGFGIYKFYTGDSYAGEWCNGQSHGVGVQSCADGSCYVGEFKCGVKHGLGCYHFRNGDRYAGEYFGDKVHGFGVYHFANGHCYEGSWHEGRKQGFGMYTFRSGDTKCGEWDCNTLKIYLPPLTDAVLRAVQAARRTAENAINLRSVDEQVNKSVTAANRAATAARVAAVKAVQNQMDDQIHPGKSTS